MSLSERLDRAQKAASYSTQDLATWFDLPYPTIRSYLKGAEPYPYRRPQVEQRLAWLERALEQDPRLPVPGLVAGLGEQRRRYILQVRASYEQ